MRPLLLDEFPGRHARYPVKGADKAAGCGVVEVLRKLSNRQVRILLKAFASLAESNALDHALVGEAIGLQMALQASNGGADEFVRLRNGGDPDEWELIGEGLFH